MIIENENFSKPFEKTEMTPFERAKQILHEIFEQRGYTDLSQTNDRLLAKKTDGSSICAFLRLISKLNITEIKAIMSVMESEKITHAIIIYSDKPTPAVKDILEDHSEVAGMHIEMFSVDDLQYNITKHYLVPKHRVVPKFSGDKKNLPILFRTDPISRFYDMKTGDVVEVTRNNGEIAYRVVR